MKELKILNARYPDFVSGKMVAADVLIDRGKILKLERPGVITEETRHTIDGADQILSPGFINIHGHEDLMEDHFFSSYRELLDGVTTIAGGNCGDNNYPITAFVSEISSKGSPTNFCMFVGQNYLRELAGAVDPYRPSTPVQQEKMKIKLNEICREISPVGLSCGFEYAPGVTTEETIDLINSLDKSDYLISVHSRGDGPSAVEATEELVLISQKTGLAMQMSHIGSCSASGYMSQTLDVIDKARTSGVDIAADCYPYDAFCTSIGSAVFDGDCFSQWNYEDIMITDGAYKNMRCTEELFEKVRAQSPEMYVVAFVMNEAEIELAYRQPYVMVGSDGIYLHGAGHPRGAGTFARVLSRYVRERGTMSLTEALYKMTLQPARRLGLAKKGEIREGFDADLVLFSEEKIRDRATFENATLPPEGINYVLIGGKVAVKGTDILNPSLGTYIRPTR